MIKLDKEVREGLYKLYCFDDDGSLNAGEIEPEMQIQNLLSVITSNSVRRGYALYGIVRRGVALSRAAQ